MTKPEDIPQRVWDEAEEPAEVCFDGAVDLYETGVESSNLQLVIARAILAAEKREREACAVIVENMPIQIYRDTGIGPVGRSCKPATFEDAATAIRNRNGE